MHIAGLFLSVGALVAFLTGTQTQPIISANVEVVHPTSTPQPTISGEVLSAQELPDDIPPFTQAPRMSATATPTKTPVPSHTLIPTNTAPTSVTPTSTPTKQPEPTQTPFPTNTPTPVPSSPTPQPTIPLLSYTSEDLDRWFTQYGAQYSVDVNLLRKIAACESGFNARSYNSAGYAGMFQFSSGTWQSTRRALGMDDNPELRFNPEESIRTAAFKISRNGPGAWPSCSS